MPPLPPSALMARFMSGHMTTSSMPSMARLESSYGNLKREVGNPPPPSALMARFTSGHRTKLYAINGKTGVKLWEFETEVMCTPPAIGSDGTVYVGSGDKSSMPSMARLGQAMGI